MKKIYFFVPYVFFVLPLFAQDNDSLLTLESLTEIMIEENPVLKSKSKTTESFEKKISQAGTLPDPVLTAGFLSFPMDNYVFNQEPMTQKMIGINQKFPFFGKLDLSENIARYEYEIKQEDYQNFQLQMVKRLEQLYFTLFFNYKSIGIMNKNKVLLADFVEIASTKYSVGKGIQQDVLKSQVELLKIEQRLIELRQANASIKSQINIMLNRLPQSELSNPAEHEIREINLVLDSLQSLAVQNNPALQAVKIKISKSKSVYQLAKTDYFPDFGVSVNYGQREGRPDFISGLISINIPLYAGSKQSQKIQETALAQQAANYEFTNEVNETKKNVKIIVDEIQKNSELLQLYKSGILPQAEQALESAIAAYRTDKVDFITLLNNQLTLLNYELEYFRIVSEYNANISDLAFICGIKRVDLF